MDSSKRATNRKGQLACFEEDFRRALNEPWSGDDMTL